MVSKSEYYAAYNVGETPVTPGSISSSHSISIVRFLKVAFRSAKVRIDATFAERKATLIFRTMLSSALFFRWESRP